VQSTSYITAAGAFLPGEPVGNDAMEDHIGRIGGRSSALGKRALRWNGVETRHYAIDADGTPRHDNADLAARAVSDALEASGRRLKDLDFLATATTQGDLIVPGHASAVHAALKAPPLELASFQSVCASSLMAAKSAMLHVKAGEAACAAAVGSELSSRWFRPEFYEDTDLVDAKGRARLEAEFLRWTLSDGAGAIVVEPKPRADGISLRIDWIDLVSYADRFDVCMWAGAPQSERFDLKQSWSFQGPRAAAQAGAIALQQDFDLLKPIIRAWVARFLELVEDGRIDPQAVDHVLCHYSAESLRVEIVDLLKAAGAMVPEERWFSNLKTKGNTGAAAIYIMLEEWWRTRPPKAGERILCVVPESGRAMIGFMMLTVVENGT